MGETRTTIVLETPIYQHLKIQAMLENKPMKTLIAEFICKGLRPIEKIKLGEK